MADKSRSAFHSGYDVYTSSIYAFKLKDPSQSNYDVSIFIMLDAIRNAISEENTIPCLKTMDHYQRAEK